MRQFVQYSRLESTIHPCLEQAPRFSYLLDPTLSLVLQAHLQYEAQDQHTCRKWCVNCFAKRRVA
jgi:hypothetical protein